MFRPGICKIDTLFLPLKITDSSTDPKNMKLDSKTASFYYSRPSEWLAGRKAVVPCAHILGGGSSINFMMYTRASASDYDDFQAKGWSTKELIPLMKKHETYQRACNNRSVDIPSN